MRKHTKRLLGGFALACAAFAAAPAGAAPLDEYFAARDGYVAKFDPGQKEVDWDKIAQPHEAALEDLAKRLRAMIGESALKDADAGKNNLSSLVKGDQDFGKLDGVLFKPNGGKAEVVVTTKALLTKYLVEHKEWWRSNDVPQTIPTALAFDGFYTQALSGDAAVTKYAVLPVTKPADAEFAFAMLDERDQDAGVGKADEIIVSVVRNERVYIASAPIEGRAPAFSTCDAAWKIARRKVANSDGARAEAFELDGAEAYRRCYLKHLKATPQFHAMTAQAQKLIDAVSR